MGSLCLDTLLEECLIDILDYSVVHNIVVYAHEINLLLVFLFLHPIVKYFWLEPGD